MQSAKEEFKHIHHICISTDETYIIYREYHTVFDTGYNIRYQHKIIDNKLVLDSFVVEYRHEIIPWEQLIERKTAQPIIKLIKLIEENK